jgi:hypothetical protein
MWKDFEFTVRVQNRKHRIPTPSSIPFFSHSLKRQRIRKEESISGI